MGKPRIVLKRERDGCGGVVDEEAEILLSKRAIPIVKYDILVKEAIENGKSVVVS